ncbi:hypothetical protein SRABI70_02202 [Pseudomonas sp. Bi70]|uniref:hypothetical protein n=1 Tax=Pseudomonas sp. Bi70 TaxID=2821127 RepID=UPI001D310D0F|nr:hypothetical protein [Pseudomonas sp. Bi70]CAH0219717.1 hypothetical protein SRABI70_02202 [Pseudomonas sp. Bi70]
MDKTCLKCGQKHQFDQVLRSTACPSCGAIYVKVEQAIENAMRFQARIQPVNEPQKIPSSNTTTALQRALLGCCAVLAISTTALGAMYYQELRLNRVLLSQRDIKPEVPIANPAPAIAAAPMQVRPKSELPSTSKPPANLAEDAEIIVVSGYEADNQASNGTVVQVLIDRPGKSVLLVLTSYDKIAWHVNASDGTRIKGIVISANELPRIYTEVAAPIFQSKLPYSYEKNSGNFAGILKGLHKLFGIEQVDVFRGKYALPNSITIDKLDPPQSDLTLQGDQPQAPLKPLEFELVTSDYDKALWSLEGASSSISQADLNPGRAVKAAQDQRIYQIVGHEFQVLDPSTGKKIWLEMPDNFPSLSWPMDVAYDSKRHYVALASLGGEGFLYRLDTNTGKWLDFRSLNNVDISSLAYDELADRYVAWTTEGSLLFVASDGTPLYTKHLADRLPGFNRLYDTGNSQPPSLMVVPRGDQIALVKPDGRSVGLIWYYDVQLDIVQLTYKQANAEVRQ